MIASEKESEKLNISIKTFESKIKRKKEKQKGLKEKIALLEQQELNDSELKRKVCQYKETIEDLQEQLNKINESIIKNARRSRSNSMSTGGIRSTLKALQTIEDEQNKVEPKKNYEAEIEENQKTIKNLLKEIEIIGKEKKEVESKLADFCENKQIEAILKRAVKLHNYIADKLTTSRIDYSPDPWKIVDLFTRQARAYIRKSENSKHKVEKFKSAKGKFIEYIEKEVCELTKSWNLMDSERLKLNEMMKRLASQDKEKYLNIKEKKVKLKAEITELENKKLKLLEGIDQFLVNEQETKENIRKEIENSHMILENLENKINDYNSEISSLTKEIENILTKKTELEKDIQILEFNQSKNQFHDEQSVAISEQQCHASKEELANLEQEINERKKTLKLLNNEISSHEFILEKHKQKVLKYQDKVNTLRVEIKNLSNSP